TGADDQDGGDICSFGHQLSDWKLGTKKGRAYRASPEPRARVTLARGWSLDQIPHPRNPQKRAINGEIGGFGGLRIVGWGRSPSLCELPPTLCELRRDEPTWEGWLA